MTGYTYFTTPIIASDIPRKLNVEEMIARAMYRNQILRIKNRLAIVLSNC